MLHTRENSDVVNSLDEIYLVFTSKKQISSISSPLKLMTMIPIAREKMKNVKCFGHLLSPSKKDASGITSIKENGILKTDTVDKANICNKQFQSAFTFLSGFVSPVTTRGPVVL